METQAFLEPPINPPIVGLAMEDDNRREISLLLAQILSPIYYIVGVTLLGG